MNATATPTALTTEPGRTGRGTAATTGTLLLWNDHLVGITTAHGDTYDTCKRCGGGGVYAYNSWENDDTCYGCNGDGLGALTTPEDITRRAINRDKAAAAKEAKRVREVAARDAKIAEFKSANADLWAILETHLPKLEVCEYSGYPSRWAATTFLAKLAVQVEDQYKPLTDRQIEAAWTAIRKRQAKDEAATAAGHLGEVGDKIQLQVTVTRRRTFETQFGMQALVGMRTEAGHELVTFTSGAFGWAVEEGQTLEIKGTVKEHGHYQDIPQTTLFRVKAVAV